MSVVVERAGGWIDVLRAYVRAQARHLERIRLPQALTYAIPALAALVISQRWFSSGRFIAGGDLAPFVRDNLAHETGGLWSHSITGAGSPSFQAAARAPELAMLSFAHGLGLSDEIAQRIFYTILAVAVAISAVYFVLAFVEQALGVVLAGLLALLNPFVLQHLLNPLVLWALTLMAVSGGLLVRAARGARPRGLALGSLSLFAGYLSLNPPLLAVLGGWILLLASLGRVVGGAGGSRRALALLLRAAPWAFVLGLWWAVPFGMTLAKGGTGYAIGAQINAFGWLWTQARDSIPNVISLSGHWGWAFPEYYPYASAMDGTFWASLRFGMPLLAFLAPFAARPPRRWGAAVLALIAVALLFLSKGVHPPLSGANLFLYRHVPGMWLLRTPDSKLGLPILLIYLVLIAIAVDGLAELVQKSSGRPRRWLIRTTSAMAVAALAYPYPIWTGAVVPDRRPVLPPAHVKVPAEWQQIASLLNRSTIPGKVLVLPLADYYQMPTTWGYYGADAIPRSLLRRPTIQPLPGGYYSDLPGFRALVAATQLAVQTGDSVALTRLLRSLGVTYVIVRNDIDLRYFSSAATRHVVDPSTLETGLQAAPSLTRIRSTSVADVYRVEGGARGTLGVAGSVFHLRTSGPLGLPLAVGSLPAGGAIVDAGAPVTSGTVYATTPTHPTIRFESGGGEVVVAARRTGNELVWAAIESGAKRSTLRLTRAATAELDGAGLQPISIATLRVPHGAVAAVGVNGRISLVQRKAALVALDPRSQVTAYAAAQRPSNSLKRFSSVGDCHSSDTKTLAQAGISARPLAGEPGQAVRLEARYHSACVSSLLKGFIPGAPYLLSFQYRTMSGRPARVCLWEVGPSRCAQLPPLEPSSTWWTFRAVATADPGTTGLRLFLYADGTGRGSPTVTEYRDLSVRYAPPFGLVVYPRTATAPSKPLIDWQQSGPSTFRAAVGPLDRPSLLFLRESFGSGWQLHGLPSEVLAHHAELDGYGNGWLVRPGPGFRAEIAYGPDGWVHGARMASGIGLLAAGLWIVMGPRKRRSRVIFLLTRTWARRHSDLPSYVRSVTARLRRLSS